MLKKFGLYSIGLALLATFSLGHSQQQKTPPSSSSTDALTAKRRAEAVNKDQLTQWMARVGVQVSDANANTTPISGYRQLNITLSTPDQPQTTSVDQLRTAEASISVRSSEVKQGTLPKRRSFQIASDQLLIVTVDHQSRLRWWSTIPDPRILRAERPGPNGLLTGEVIFQKSVHFTLNIPADSAAVELRLYHARATGQELVPVLISSMPLNN